MKKNAMKRISVILCLALVITMIPFMNAKAETGSIEVTSDGGTIRLTTGDSTRLMVGTSVWYWGQSYSVSRCEFSSDNSMIASVDANGNVSALQAGSTTITVWVYTTQQNSYDYGDYDDDDYDDDDYDDYYNLYGDISFKTNAWDQETLLFRAYYEVGVCPDLSDVEVDKTSQNGYATGYWNMPTYTFYLKSKEVLTADDNTMELSYTSSNENIGVYASLEENVLSITPYEAGKATITVFINNKEICRLTINTTIVNMNVNSALLSAKQTKQLKVKGCKSSEVKWSSSNPKVVSVSSKGVIKAKKNGNAVIKAKVGDAMFGCAVSVVSANRKKAVNTAIHIAKTCTYSQPKRMQSKYYDCSSLVWKSYHKNGVNFGGKNYAPVAADIGKWCADKKKMIKGGLSQKNIDNMKLNAGDLMFATGSSNGRYKGIYHVEMIVGYNCLGFDYDGKPMLEIKWAARPDGYYGACGEPVGRP